MKAKENYGRLNFEQFTADDRIISEYYYIDENEDDLIVTFLLYWDLD